MKKLVNIAFQGGTHGNFLRHCIDKFSTKTPPIQGSPFTDNHTSHNKEINYSPMVTKVEPFTEIRPADTGTPQVLITINHDDLLFLERIVTIRGGDFQVNTNSDHIQITKEFDALYGWNSRIQDLYKVDIVKHGVPRFILRDFYKLAFLDPAKNGFIERDEILKSQIPLSEQSFYFPVSSFYDKSKFKSTMQELSEKLSLDLDLSDLSVHNEFLDRLHFYDTRFRAIAITEAIVDGKDMDITDIDTVEQAYISSWMEKHTEYVNAPLTNHYFSTTGEIKKYMDLYPKHYKAMNPNLPTFNGSPNPYYLWNLGKNYVVKIFKKR